MTSRDNALTVAKFYVFGGAQVNDASPNATQQDDSEPTNTLYCFNVDGSDEQPIAVQPSTSVAPQPRTGACLQVRLRHCTCFVRVSMLLLTCYDCSRSLVTIACCSLAALAVNTAGCATHGRLTSTRMSGAWYVGLHIWPGVGDVSWPEVLSATSPPSHPQPPHCS